MKVFVLTTCNSASFEASCQAHVLALTATASKAVLQAAISVLHMDNPKIIAAKPERSNIFLSVVKKTEVIEVVHDIAHSALSSQAEGPTAFPRLWSFAEGMCETNTYIPCTCNKYALQ